MGSCAFPIIEKTNEVVAALLPMEEHWLPMSNLDLLLPPLDVGIFFCYKNEQNLSTPQNMVGVIKKALAQALVSFYPFAGEVVQNRLGEPELLCNNRGVDFVHAYSDIDLKDFDLYHPDISIHGKFVPFKKHGVLAIQVTELKCGGLVIGCTFDHRVADAHSANMFLTAWAEIAQAKGTTYAPSFRRSILNPRRPTTYDASIDDFYVLISSLPPPKEIRASDDRLISRIYYIEAKEISRLQSIASYNGSRRTKLESFSAFLWKTIAEGIRSQIKRFNLGIVVDGRKRLKGRDEEKTLAMQNYFGNVLSIPYVEANVCDLKKMTLKGVAEMVHACIEDATEDHYLGLIDWVELNRPHQAVARVYCKNCDDEEAIVVSSGLRFPASQMNFGWGMPDFGSYHFPWGGQTGYVMPMPSLSKDGDWIVYMHILKRHLDIVESKAASVFRPLNSTYLKMIKGC